MINYCNDKRGFLTAIVPHELPHTALGLSDLCLNRGRVCSIASSTARLLAFTHRSCFATTCNIIHDQTQPMIHEYYCSRSWAVESDWSVGKLWMAMFARPYTPSTTHSIGGEGQRPDYILRLQDNYNRHTDLQTSVGVARMHACMLRQADNSITNY